MYILDSPAALAILVPRKGGGGHGGASAGHGDASAGKSSSPGTSHPSDTSGGGGARAPIVVAGLSRANMVPYGGGGGKPEKIPSGVPFVGRYRGGGTRGQVYGTRYVSFIYFARSARSSLRCLVHSVYGSGYPGTSNNYCVVGCNFPFWFWPVPWEPSPYALYPRPQYMNSREVCGCSCVALFPTD